MKIVSEGPSAIALLTPTRERHLAFSFCERWMASQDWPGVAQWIVVDDSASPLQTTMGQRTVHRGPQAKAMTLPDNLIEALRWLDPQPHIVFIIEDDDWYSPRYVSRMIQEFEADGPWDVVGPYDHIYYNLGSRRWCVNRNDHHASLCTTAFRRSAIGAFAGVLSACAEKEDPYIDMMFWNGKADGLRKKVFRDNSINVGLKGWPGRPPVGSGKSLGRKYPTDLHFKELSRMIGQENVTEIYREIYKWRRTPVGS